MIELAKVRNIWEQVCGEWSDFERDVRDEIKYLEQTVLESNSGSIQYITGKKD